MTEEELMKKIQELADARAEKFVFKKTARMEHIYTEELPEGEKDVFVLGSDMPKLIYRIFHVSAAGEISEIEDVKVLAEEQTLQCRYQTDLKISPSGSGRERRIRNCLREQNARRRC